MPGGAEGHDGHHGEARCRRKASSPSLSHSQYPNPLPPRNGWCPGLLGGKTLVRFSPSQTGTNDTPCPITRLSTLPPPVLRISKRPRRSPTQRQLGLKTKLISHAISEGRTWKSDLKYIVTIIFPFYIQRVNKSPAEARRPHGTWRGAGCQAGHRGGGRRRLKGLPSPRPRFRDPDPLK